MRKSTNTNNHYYQHETNLSVANRFTPLPGWDLCLSADHQFNLLDADLTDFAYPRRHTTLMAAATSFDFGALRLQASLLGTWVHDKVRAGAASASDKWEWTPAAVASYRPFRDIDLVTPAAPQAATQSGVR